MFKEKKENFDKSQFSAIEDSRKKKFGKLEFNPFKEIRFEKDILVHEIIERFQKENRLSLEKKKSFFGISGRILRIRNFGVLNFLDVSDTSDKIQLIIENKEINVSNLDIGDIVGVKGYITKSKKGELSIKVNELTILSKCFKPLPDKHYGFSDIEERFRKRYLDFIINPENRKVLVDRHKIIREIRNFFDRRGFLEVETPILVSESSGALAKPFVTYHNKLGRKFFLRIATEIALKKLLVGGFEKVYEIGRIFRNEGIDARHNPEFTTIEVYQAYEDCNKMMELTESLFKEVAKSLEKDTFEFNSHLIKLKDFKRMSMIESIEKYSGIDFRKIGLEESLALAEKHEIKLEKFQENRGNVIIGFFEKYVEGKLIQPTIIYDYPLEVSPLAKSKGNEAEIADRFELFIGGLEFANGYSELNDPYEQRERFKEQSKQKSMGNEETSDFDKEFIESLEYGMPPAGGLGIGVDRLVMLMTEKNGIKEVIAFPQLKKK